MLDEFPQYNPDPDEASLDYSDEWRDGFDDDDRDDDGFPDPVVGMHVAILDRGAEFPRTFDGEVIGLVGSRACKVRLQFGQLFTVDNDDIVAIWTEA